MIVQFNSEGRFGHQLTQLVVLVANAIKYGTSFFQPVINNVYDKDLDLSALIADGLIEMNDYGKVRHLKRSYRLFKLMGISEIRWFGDKFFIHQKGSEEMLSIADRNIFKTAGDEHVITDFILKDIPTILEMRHEVCKYLRPVPEVQKSIDVLIDRLTSDHDLLLGLHIRKGDYRTFAGGRFLIEDGEFARVVEQFCEACNISRKRIAIAICSDERVDTSVFKDLDIYYEERTYAEDFFILSRCDYIIAPHSLFSVMANYIGDNKIYQVLDQKKRLGMSDFLNSDDLLGSRYLDLRYVEELDGS